MFNQCKQAFSGKNKWRHLACLGLILLLSTTFFTLVGARLLPGTQKVYRHQTISSQADETTIPLGEGDVLEQNFYVFGPLYGVALRPDTGGKVLRGTLTLELIRLDTGETREVTTYPLEMLQHDEWTDFAFTSPIDNGADGEDPFHAIRLTAQPDTPEDTLRFYKSIGTPDYHFDEVLGTAQYTFLDNFWMRQNDEWAGEMLQLQYLIDETGDFLIRPYFFFAAFLTVLLLVVYLLAFVVHWPLHRLYWVCAMGLGLVFLFLIPPRAVPDEYAHISTAYHYTNRLLGTAESDVLGTSLWVREGDASKLYNYDPTSIDLFAYKDIAQNLFAAAPQGPGQVIAARTIWVLPTQLAAPALGVLLARLLGLGHVGLLLLGRLSNLLFFATVASRAIKRMPLAKPLLFAVGLLPMTLQLAASFSYDTYVMALAFYLLACCLDYRVNKTPVGWRQILLLGALCLLLAPAKSVYLPLLLLLFLIKPAQFASKKVCWAARSGILLAGAGLWLVFTASSLLLSAGVQVVAQQPAAAVVTTGVAQAGEEVLTPSVAKHMPQQPHAATVPAGGGADDNRMEGYKGETKPNGDAVQLYTVGYILRHLPGTAKLLARTVWQQGPLWLQGLVGGRLGEIIAVDIEISWTLMAGLLLIMLLSCLCDGEDNRLLPKKHRLSFAGIALVTAAAAVMAALTWTPVNYLTIFGIQGRYLLPVLPLLLLALRGGNLRLAKPIWRPLAFAQVALVVLVQMNAFAEIIHLPT